MKKEIIYSILIGIILGILIGYFLFTSSNNLKLKICPDKWYDNQMPTNYKNNINKQYFIINNERLEISSFDIDWIKKNCKINHPTTIR